MNSAGIYTNRGWVLNFNDQQSTICGAIKDGIGIYAGGRREKLRGPTRYIEWAGVTSRYEGGTDVLPDTVAICGC